MLRNLKLSDPADVAHAAHPTAAQWIASRTRSMFGQKSKSCTDLHQIDRGVSFKPAGMEVK